MGAAPSDEPDGFDRRDIIFFVVMVMIFAFAIIASKHI